MIKTYESQPVKIEAVELTHETKKFLIEWMGDSYDGHSDCAEDVSWLQMYIGTPEGRMTASMGDYIIKGTIGEFYPCKPEVFERKYRELV